MSQSNSGSSGIGFLPLLTILFIGLKLTGFISWSWVWVLAPLWIPISLALGIVVVLFLGVFVMAFITSRSNNNSYYEELKDYFSKGSVKTFKRRK